MQGKMLNTVDLIYIKRNFPASLPLLPLTEIQNLLHTVVSMWGRENGARIMVWFLAVTWNFFQVVFLINTFIS